MTQVSQADVYFAAGVVSVLRTPSLLLTTLLNKAAGETGEQLRNLCARAQAVTDKTTNRELVELSEEILEWCKRNGGVPVVNVGTLN